MDRNEQEMAAKIEDLNKLIEELQRQNNEAIAVNKTLRRRIAAAERDRNDAWDIVEQRDRRVRDLIRELNGSQELVPAGPFTLIGPSYVSIPSHDFCPQCGMVMSPQCGARCGVCGFKSSCSMEPT